MSNVEQAGGKKQTGFVNAVLRQIARHITDRQIDLAQVNPLRTLVQSPQSGCQFDTDLLPDPQTSLPDYLSICFSLPPWLVGEWLNDFGPDQTQQVCLACNRRPSLYVRVNPLRTTAQELRDRFEQAGVHAELVAPGGIVKAEGLDDGPTHTLGDHRQAALTMPPNRR